MAALTRGAVLYERGTPEAFSGEHSRDGVGMMRGCGDLAALDGRVGQKRAPRCHLEVRGLGLSVEGSRFRV